MEKVDYKKLEDSITSHPESMYIDESDYNYKNIKICVLANTENIDDDIVSNYLDNEIDIPLESNNQINVLLESSVKEINTKDKLESKSADIFGGYDNFFSYYDDDISINNAIACHNKDINCKDNIDNNIEVSSLFEQDSNNNDDSYPFDIHDANVYDVDKIKHKKQKNMDRFGMVALFALFIMKND